MIFLPLIVLLLRIPPALRRTLACTTFAILLIFGLPSSTSRAEQKDNQQGKLLRREGAQLKAVIGEISPAGRRWVFVASDNHTYRLLENLTLQRVVRSMQRNADDKRWVVDGEITEFLDENFLRLTRANRSLLPDRSADSITAN